jgi:hypothetical protein
MHCYDGHYPIYIFLWKGLTLDGEKSESKVEKDTEIFVNEYTAGGTA